MTTEQEITDRIRAEYWRLNQEQAANEAYVGVDLDKLRAALPTEWSKEQVDDALTQLDVDIYPHVHAGAPDAPGAVPTSTRLVIDRHGRVERQQRGNIADKVEKAAAALERDANDLHGRGHPDDHDAVRQRKLDAAADVRAYADEVRNGTRPVDPKHAEILAHAAQMGGILTVPKLWPRGSFDSDEQWAAQVEQHERETAEREALVESGHFVRVDDEGQVPFYALKKYGGWTEALARQQEAKAAAAWPAPRTADAAPPAWVDDPRVTQNEDGSVTVHTAAGYRHVMQTPAKEEGQAAGWGVFATNPSTDLAEQIDVADGCPGCEEAAAGDRDLTVSAILHADTVAAVEQARQEIPDGMSEEAGDLLAQVYETNRARGIGEDLQETLDQLVDDGADKQVALDVANEIGGEGAAEKWLASREAKAAAAAGVQVDEQAAGHLGQIARTELELDKEVIEIGATIAELDQQIAAADGDTKAELLVQRDILLATQTRAAAETYTLHEERQQILAAEAGYRAQEAQWAAEDAAAEAEIAATEAANAADRLQRIDEKVAELHDETAEYDQAGWWHRLMNGAQEGDRYAETVALLGEREAIRSAQAKQAGGEAAQVQAELDEIELALDEHWSAGVRERLDAEADAAHQARLDRAEELLAKREQLLTVCTPDDAMGSRPASKQDEAASQNGQQEQGGADQSPPATGDGYKAVVTRWDGEGHSITREVTGDTQQEADEAALAALGEMGEEVPDTGDGSGFEVTVKPATSVWGGMTAEQAAAAHPAPATNQAVDDDTYE